MFENVHALIIDDNAIDADVLMSLLDRVGITATWIENYAQLDDIDAVDVKVIFLDLELPGKSGYALLDILRSHPHYQQVPIVAYTSHSSEMGNARAAGFDSFLGKPLRSTTFPDLITRILNGESVWETR